MPGPEDVVDKRTGKPQTATRPPANPQASWNGSSSVTDEAKDQNGEHEITDEELSEFEKPEIERYRLKDRPFPASKGEAAFQGIAGEIVRIIEPVSEASREAILSQLLVALGNMIGRGPHLKQAGIHHTTCIEKARPEFERAQKCRTMIPS